MKYINTETLGCNRYSAMPRNTVGTNSASIGTNSARFVNLPVRL